MFQIDEIKIDEHINLETVFISPVFQYPYTIEFYTSEKILKAKYNIGAPDCPLSSFKYEETEKGSLNGTIIIPDLELYLEYGDYVIVKYNGENDYIGRIINLPDIQEGQIKVDSLLNWMDEVYKGSFSNKTKLEILETVITSMIARTGILFNPALVDLIETTPFSPNYPSIAMKTIIEDWAYSEEDRYYKINNYGFFEVKQRESEVSEIIYPSEYQDLKYDYDLSKIKYTRIDLYRKISNVETYVATIPDGSGTYPYFTDIEDLLRSEKIRKEVAPDSLTESESKDWAYGKVLEAVTESITINLTGIPKEKRLYPGRKYRIIEYPKYCFKELVDTESLNNWNGNATLNSDAYDGNYSILINGTATYEFNPFKSFLDVKNITFYAKGSYGNVGTLSIITGFAYLNDPDNNRIKDPNGNYIVTYYEEEISDIFLDVIDSWCYIKIDLSNKIFKGLKFNLTNTKIDFINFLAIQGNYYDINCLSRSINLSPSTIDFYNAKFGSYDKSANDISFALQKEIERRQT